MSGLTRAGSTSRKLGIQRDQSTKRYVWADYLQARLEDEKQKSGCSRRLYRRRTGKWIGAICCSTRDHAGSISGRNWRLPRVALEFWRVAAKSGRPSADHDLIEGTFAPVHPHAPSEGTLSNRTALAMVFKLVEAAPGSDASRPWRLPKLILGVNSPIELAAKRRHRLTTATAGPIRCSATARRAIRDSAQSVLILKDDDDFRLLRFVRYQASELCVTPIRDIYNCPGRYAGVGVLVRLYDIQSITVEKERVIAEQFVQSRNQRMVIGNYLGFELSQSFVDLCGTQFHHALHRLFSKRAPGGGRTAAGNSTIQLLSDLTG
jgi:hypothetical protein